LEIGNELVKRGYDYTIVIPNDVNKKLTWFNFNGKIKKVGECKPQEFDIAIIGPPDCLKYYYLAKRTIIIAIHDAEWVTGPYRRFLDEHPETPIVLVNRKLKQIFPEGIIIEGAVNIEHFTPKKLRVGYYAQGYGSDVKNSRYIIEQLSDLPHIELVPIKDISNKRLPKVYRSLDYFVSWESQGAWSNTSAEALSCGVPVVTNGVNCEPFKDKVIVVNNLRDFFDKPLKELSYSRFVDKLLEVFEVANEIEIKEMQTIDKEFQPIIPEPRPVCHHILDILVANFKPNRYLEVGVGFGNNLRDLNVKEKVGIDIVKPNIGLGNVKFYLGKSDEIFKSNAFQKEKRFDLIFIDAYHEFRQCIRDFENSLKFLNKNGVIVIHDVWPFDRVNDFPYPITGKKPHNLRDDGTWDVAWCGDIWKMIFYLRHKKHLKNLRYAVIRDFPGYLVIWTDKRDRDIETKTIKEIDMLEDDYAIENQNLFNFMSPEDIVKEIYKSIQLSKISSITTTVKQKQIKDDKEAKERILLASPTFYEKLYCWNDYLEAIKSTGIKDMLFIDTSPHGKEVPMPEEADVIRLYGAKRRLNSREVLSYAYSIIFSYAQGYGYDYLWIVETDVIVKPDTLERLLESSKKTDAMVSGLIFRSDGHPQAYYDQNLWHIKGKDGLWRITRPPIPKEELKGLKKVKAVTFGCLLIPKRVYEYLKADWYSHHYNHPDGFFFERLAEIGIDVYVDCDVVVEHLQRPWKEVVW